MHEGSIDVLDTAPDASSVALSLNCSTLMELMLLGKSVEEARDKGSAEVEGDPAAAERMLDLYRMPNPMREQAPA